VARQRPEVDVEKEVVPAVLGHTQQPGGVRALGQLVGRAVECELAEYKCLLELL